MKKHEQASGDYRIEIESSDTAVVSAIGRAGFVISPHLSVSG